MRSHKLSRRALMGLFAVAVTAVAATTTGLALADESHPSVQVRLCKDGGWSGHVTGVNQRGETISDTFDGEGCTVLAKNGTAYWWAIGEGRILTVDVESTFHRFNLNLGAELNGRTMTFTLLN